MEFKHLVEAAEKWCSGNPFDLIFAEEDDERRLDFYAEPGVSFYVLCPSGTDSFGLEHSEPRRSVARVSMGAKQSSPVFDGRTRAYSSSDLPSSHSGGGERIAGFRYTGTGTGPTSSGLSMPAGGRSGARALDRSLDGTDGDDEGQPPPDGHRLLIGSLPTHLSPHLLGGFHCPICSKFMASDDIEKHLLMCFSKTRLTYNTWSTIQIKMSYMLPHLHNGWQVDQAILSEEDRVLVIRFGHDWDPTCMKMDEVLYSIAEKVKNFAVIYLVDITEVPDFNKMYELYDPCTVMFFFRNKHIMIDLGTGNNNKINWTMEDKQEMIDIVETVYRGARKGRVSALGAGQRLPEWEKSTRGSAAVQSVCDEQRTPSVVICLRRSHSDTSFHHQYTALTGAIHQRGNDGNTERSELSREKRGKKEK
ncbi:hypothetical protein F2P81_001302 [Scophthalmus maximus]|uniref:Thioredoxin-like protein 4A n=1 Tax=Scophthalmus maximus TaxID=52904 RepID=A0A6A4TS26_SCOMX|nr:hypothetical protein F2P81_001302 [Scophthalmus maximus]